MNTYYFDSSNPQVGDGSQANPFRELKSIETLTMPFHVRLKRGSEFRDNITIPTMTGVTELCTWRDYGVGKPPVLIPKDYTKKLIDSVIIKNFHILGEMDVYLGGFTFSPDRIIHLKINAETGNTANVHMKGNFNVVINSMLNVECISVYFDAQGGAAIGHRNDDMYIRGVHQRGGDRMILMWCGSTYFKPVGGGPDHKGENCRIEDCTAIGLTGDAVTLSNARGMASTPGDAAYDTSSKISNCYSTQASSMKLDANPNAIDKSRYHVPFWLYGCDNVPIEYCWADGAAFSKDCMGYDIDGRCSNCIVRRCLSTNNNGGFMMFTCTESPTLEGTMNTLADWENALITEARGNVNNTCEYVLSYNDGVGRGRYAGRYTTLQFINNVLNAKIRNCTVVDNISRYQSHLYLITPTAKGMSSGLMAKYPSSVDSCIFYHRFKHMVAGDAGFANNNGDTLVKWTKNIFWCPEDNGASMVPTKGVMSGNLSVDPKIGNMTNTSPGGLDAAKLTRLLANSPAIGAGSATVTPDLWGKTGSNIGWQQ
ncbi:hypothetical protein HWB92_gp034 [Serratia phage vB_SmaA_3M]|uniref:Uncharacterized protein n=1 Tax=Serratia phage vB_SmaA_3M TaxID=2419930 RepID=A0A3G2YS15_9CAUD|nr:hypothetical protein HWB92_gp034 [Serratia phage vB_SmaA_3M]AYP28292.1 hypothetical protein 3M_036 [Serratia phage vB_SmaA_3M]